MSDKKIIIIALILAALLIGGGWYFAKYRAPSATISQLQSSASPSPQALEPGISFGNPEAPVVIEEYTNFLCPACSHFATDTFLNIKDDYIKNGKVKIVFFIFPPLELGRAALCAQEQDKFVEYHDYVFSHQSQITEEKILKEFALNAGLNEQQFNACYDAQKYQDKVERWFNEGQARGVDATPTFFINNQKFIGAQPYEEFKKIIEEKLNQAL